MILITTFSNLQQHYLVNCCNCVHHQLTQSVVQKVMQLLIVSFKI